MAIGVRSGASDPDHDLLRYRTERLNIPIKWNYARFRVLVVVSILRRDYHTNPIFLRCTSTLALSSPTFRVSVGKDAAYRNVSSLTRPVSNCESRSTSPSIAADSASIHFRSMTSILISSRGSFGYLARTLTS